MLIRNALRAGAFGACCFAWLAAAPAALAAQLHQFTTADATLNPDDGYDPAVVSVTTDPNVSAPSNGTELAAGNNGLVRFFNTEWAGFSLSSNNGPRSTTRPSSALDTSPGR